MKQLDGETGSRLFLFRFSGSDCARSFNSCAQGEGEVLACSDAALPHDNQTGNDPESNLRSNEPEPVDVVLEQRIEKSEDGVEQARPQHRRDEATEEDRPAR